MNKAWFVFGLFLAVFFSFSVVSALSPSDYGLKEGDLISAIFSDDPDVYIINEHGYKRVFLNPEIFNFYQHLGGFFNIKLVTQEVRDSFPTSGLFRNCEDEDEKVYGVDIEGEDIGQLRWVDTTGEQAVADDPDFFKKVFCINRKEFNWYPKAQTALNTVKDVPKYERMKEAEIISTDKKLEAKTQLKNIGQVIVCHYPPDNPANSQTLTVDVSALKAHLDHGDTFGSCFVPQAIPVVPTIPASGSQPFSPIASQSVPIVPASVSFSPAPVSTSSPQATPTSVTQPASVSFMPTATPYTTSPCTGLSLTFENGKTNYVFGDTVYFTWTCVPSGSKVSYLETRLYKPDGSVIKLDTSTGGTQSTMGLGGLSNYGVGSFYIKSCFTQNCTTIAAQLSFTISSGSSPTPTPTPMPTPTSTLTSCTPINVSISPSTPSAQNINPAQSGVSLAVFNIVADCSLTLQSFAVSLLPMPNGYQNISSLRLYNNTTGAQIGSTVTVSGAGPNFTGLNTLISPSQTLSLKVVGDISSSAVNGSTVYAVFGGSSAVNSAGTFVGNNASGNVIAGRTMTIIVPTPTPTAPSSPASVNATLLSTGQIVLTWPGTSPNYYKVFRSTNGGGYVILNSITYFNYDDSSGLTSGSTYRYKIESCDVGWINCSTGTESNTVTYSLTPTPAPTSSTSFNFSRDLYVSLWGNDVKQLQALLVNEVGYSANLITGYFGNITRDAVIRLQEKYGVKPILGYFGPITRQAVQALISR